ncbi:MAG: CDP-alcohol phosphatidyltransferase family protein [Sedimentisphaerales bacterium]|nr:CDP-alcohol phosphatidyltransferase family protein [Sedimentisphaerales bacterium]
MNNSGESEPKQSNPRAYAAGPRHLRLKTESAKESFLRRMRRQRLKYITILPSLVTIINGACGFAAITFAGQAALSETGQFSYHRLTLPYFALSGYMILLAMVADMLDGRLARMSQSTSSFGGQLDSLCDIVSFGVAPAFLMLKIIEHKLSPLPDTGVSGVIISLLERFIWLAAAAYMSCAAIRLARFNVENEEDESAHMSFVGLPTPAAAGVIVSLVVFHCETVPDILAHPDRDWSTGGVVNFLLDDLLLYLLPIIALGLAVLMVSRIRYIHVINQYIRGKKPFAHLIRVLVFFGLIIWHRQFAFVLIFCGFALSGFLKWFYFAVIRKGRLIPGHSPGAVFE